MIAVRVQNDGQSGKKILAAKYWAVDESLFRIPYRKSVAEQIFAFAADFEIDIDLPVLRHNRLYKKETKFTMT